MCCIFAYQLINKTGVHQYKHGKTIMTTQEIFAANQILTVDIAKSLIGQRIQTVYSGYRGQDGDDSFVIGQVVSELEYYRNLKEECYQNDPKFKNRAEYWESYMTEKQLSEHRNKMVIITADGRNTFIYAHHFNNGAFTCSDSDRYVYFMIIGYPDPTRTVSTKEEALNSAISEISKLLKVEIDSYSNYKVNEISAGVCEATDFLPAIQIIDNGKLGINTTWRYINEN